MRKVINNLLKLSLSLLMIVTTLTTGTNSVEAATFNNDASSVTNMVKYPSGYLKSIDISIQAIEEDSAGYAEAYGKIAIHKGISDYDWENRYVSGENLDWPDSYEQDTTFLSLSDDEFLWTDCEVHTVTVTFPDGIVPIDNASGVTSYNIYLWTRSSQFGVYPDYKFEKQLQVNNGKLLYDGNEVELSSSPATHDHQGYENAIALNQNNISDYQRISDDENTPTYYYLEEDIDIDNNEINIVKGDVHFCLNGHSLTSNSESGGETFKINTASLTIDDCIGTGKIVNTGSDGHVFWLEWTNTCTLVVNEGTFISDGEVIQIREFNKNMSNYFDYILPKTIIINGGTFGAKQIIEEKSEYKVIYLTQRNIEVEIHNAKFFGRVLVEVDDTKDFVMSNSCIIANTKYSYDSALELSKNDNTRGTCALLEGNTIINKGGTALTLGGFSDYDSYNDKSKNSTGFEYFDTITLRNNILHFDISANAAIQSYGSSTLKVVDGFECKQITSGGFKDNAPFLDAYIIYDYEDEMLLNLDLTSTNSYDKFYLAVPNEFIQSYLQYGDLDSFERALFHPYLKADQDTLSKIKISNLPLGTYERRTGNTVDIFRNKILEQPSLENGMTINVYPTSTDEDVIVSYNWYKVKESSSSITSNKIASDDLHRKFLYISDENDFDIHYDVASDTWSNITYTEDEEDTIAEGYMVVELEEGQTIKVTPVNTDNANIAMAMFALMDDNESYYSMDIRNDGDLSKPAVLTAPYSGCYMIKGIGCDENYDYAPIPAKIGIVEYIVDETPIKGQITNKLNANVNDSVLAKVTWTEPDGRSFTKQTEIVTVCTPSVEMADGIGVLRNSTNKEIEKVYVYKAKSDVNALEKETNQPGYYTVYKNLTDDGTNFKTFVASETNPIVDGQKFKFEEPGQYIIRIKYLDGNTTKYASDVIVVAESEIMSVEPKMDFTSDGKFAVLELNGCENIQKLYVGYAQTSNVDSTKDYTVYSNFTSTADSYKIESNVKENKQFVLDRPGYSYVFRIKYQDLDGTSKYVAYTFECPTKQNLKATTAYLDINKNTINVVMEDGRAIDSIKLLSNDKEVTSNSKKTSINAPFNGNYKVVVTDVAGFDYSFNADISLTSLGEIKDLEALSRLKTKINDFLTKVSSTESNIIRVGDEKDYLAINSVARQTLTDEITNKVNPILNNSSSYNQKQITEAFNSLNNAFNLFLTKLQVNVLSVTGNSNDGYSITIADGSDEIKIETVYVKGSSTDIDGNSKSQGIFLEDYADFVSVGKHEALTPGQTTTRLPGVYTVRYKVKLNMIVGEGDEAQVIDNEFRAASYLMLLDGSSELNDVTKFLESNVYDGLDMYRKAVNLGFAENIEDPSKNKQFATDLETALTNVDTNLITVNRGTNEANEMVISTSNPSKLEFTRPTFENTIYPVQVSINYILNIREKLSDMPKLSDNASKTLYKSYLYGTNSKVVTGAEFDEGDFLNPEHTTVVKGNEDKKDDVKKLDNPTITLNADTKYVRIGVNNISNVRVAFGDFDKNSSWIEFSSVPYSTYYDSVFNYTPKWNGKYTVRIKYFDNSYEYLHFTVTGAPDPIKEIIRGKDSFKIVAADGYAIDSILYAYSGIGDNNYWPATNEGDNTFTALALGAGEHMFKIRAEFQGSLNEYYVKDSGFEPGFNEYQPVVVNYTDGDKTIVGIYSDSKNTLSVVYGNLGETSSWNEIQKIDGITYTTKNGAISLDNAEGLVKFAFALKDNNIVIKDVGTSSNSEN